ncbi:hypothetical protein L1987_24161 [Smallanthus sonchifolius]|uniref:Uncharacterized protein n=1 Tax=Smallanthus sonchifolius TaxID=185202 RepID=A0ACB9IKK1_9ASTR|nr:hypothetical protein L1987_24161 [Smallanthus sonchifolius]
MKILLKSWITKKISRRIRHRKNRTSSCAIFDKMNLKKLQPTKLELCLTNRTVRYPKGIAEDVLIKINEFVFPMDFVVVDIKEGTSSPVILGRPFLNTALALIDVWWGRLALSIQQERITFDLKRAMQWPSSHDNLTFLFDDFDYLVGYYMHDVLGKEEEE